MPAPPMPGPPATPRVPYVLVGKSYTPADVLQQGAVIRIEDLTLGESLSSLTSDANGEYIADLANLPSDYSNADTLKITCEARGYRQTKISAINTSNPGEEIVFNKNTTYIIMVM